MDNKPISSDKKPKKFRVNSITGYAVFIFSFLVVTAVVRYITSQISNHNAISNTTQYFQGEGWKDFNSTAGHFKLQFPSYPSESTKTVPATSTTPELVYTMYGAKDADGNYYVATDITYPDSVDVSNPQSNLEGAVNGSVAAVKGTLTSSNFTTYAGYPAVDYTMQANGGYVKYRGIMVNHTIYGLGITSTTNSFPNFDKFVNSLSFTTQ